MKHELLFAKILRMVVFTGILFASVTACKKDKHLDSDTKKVETPVDNAPTTGSRTEFTKDSVFLFARQIYLWWDELPNYQTFNPRSRFNSGTELQSLEEEVFAITRYGINPSTKLPYEYDPEDEQTPKYSYIVDATQQNPVVSTANRQSSVDLEGNGFDFGLRVGLYGSPTSYEVLIQSVFPGSDAASKGLQRGDIITVIDGRSVGSNYNAELSYLDRLFDASTVSIRVNKGSGGTVNLSLTRSSYKSSPVLKDAVYTAGAKKIGYMVYSRFSNLSNSQADFQRVFSSFASQGVTDLIIDLRYNGGGYVSTAEELINYIAPSSLNGKVMYSEHFNALMQQKKATILTKKLILNSFGQSQDSNNDGKLDTYFDVDYDVASNTNYFMKKGNLNNIQNVVFIVSGSTASASELVINSLKPYLNVKLVGETTYGKPVGFFPIRIDKYDLYLSMFESKNSRNEGGYFSGMTPDTGNSTADDDYSEYDWGDSRESSFAAAFNYLTKGTFTASAKSSSKTLATPPKALDEPGKKRFGDNEFKGMIEDRIKVQ